MCQIDGLRQMSRASLKVRRIEQVRRLWRVPQALLEAGGVARPHLPLVPRRFDGDATRIYVSRFDLLRTKTARSKRDGWGCCRQS
jgi:hypothetical protein